MIIGISGYINQGKDLTGSIIQYLHDFSIYKYFTHEKTEEDFNSYIRNKHNKNSHWKIKKFAKKLKEITSILTGIPEEKFEDQEFKKHYLPNEWTTYKFKASNGEYYHFGTNNDIRKYNKYGYDTVRMTVREFLQKLGTEAIRDVIHPNAWVNALMSEYIQEEDYQVGTTPENLKWVEGDLPKWIITDVRFPNEAQAIRDKGGIIVRIYRNSYTLEERNKMHPSETSLDNWKFDEVIWNDGTITELIEKVDGSLGKYIYNT